MDTFNIIQNDFRGTSLIGSNTVIISGSRECTAIEHQNSSDVDSSNSIETPLDKNVINHRPVVFISYSWDCESHKQWVKKMADDLKSKGIRVIYDQDIPYGTPLPNFMKCSIQSADKVLIIGTPKYLQRSKEGGTGCQFEDYVITENIYNEFDTTKFIPVLRMGTFHTSFPSLLSKRKGLDFSNDTQYNENINELVQALLGE